MRISDRYESILDGQDGRYKIVDKATSRTLGWCQKWYQRDTLNDTGVPVWRSSVLCGGVIRNDHPTYLSALSAVIDAWS